MSASSCSLDDSDKLLLRWSEDAFSPSREEFVQMLEARSSEAVICSALRLVEKTEVFLIGKHSTESGVVRSCRPSGGKFIVTILIHSQSQKPPDIDPGVLILDSFMTEEQEQSILDEIDRELEGQHFQSQQFQALTSVEMTLAKAGLNSTPLQSTSALNRILKFTLRSSTALVPNTLVQFWGKFRQAAGTCCSGRTESGRGTLASSGTVSGSLASRKLVSGPVQ